MKEMKLVILSVICIVLFTSCEEINQATENKLELLQQKADSLDKMVDKGLDKAMKIDSFVDQKMETVLKVDSMIDSTSIRLDSIATEKKKKLELLTQ